MERINEIIEQVKQIPMETLINILIALVIVAIFYLFSYLFAYFIIKIFNMKVKNKNKIKKNSFYKPIQLAVALFGVYLATLFLNLPSEAMNVITKIFKICIICLTARGFANMIKPTSKFIKKLQNNSKLNGNDTVINFVIKTVRGIIYIIAGFMIITEFGYNLNGLVAGLGLGGVIVALAAQDIAKNLFAGFAILFDKPFSVGDWIEAKTIEGTVEDISFRSTKIRTADNTIVTIPNNLLADDKVVNYAKMEKRRYLTNLVVVLDTSIQELSDLMEKMKFVLSNHEHVLPDSVQIHFDKITDDGLNIFIYLYTDITDYVGFLDFKESINLVLLHVLEAQKIELAYPTKTVYLKK